MNRLTPQKLVAADYGDPLGSDDDSEFRRDSKLLRPRSAMRSLEVSGTRLRGQVINYLTTHPRELRLGLWCIFPLTIWIAAFIGSAAFTINVQAAALEAARQAAIANSITCAEIRPPRCPEPEPCRRCTRCRCSEITAKEALRMRLACPVCAVTEGMATSMFSLNDSNIKDGGRGKRAWANYVRTTLAGLKNKKWRRPTSKELSTLLHYDGSLYQGLKRPASMEALQSEPLPTKALTSFFWSHYGKKIPLKTFLEVGSGVGDNTVFWGQMMKEADEGGLVISVDTWVGGKPMHTFEALQPIVAKDRHGSPHLYELFLQRIVDAQLEKQVLPIRMPPLSAARFFFDLKYHVDVVYVAGSDEPGETFLQMTHLWDVLRHGGVMMGADFEFAPIYDEVQLFFKLKEVHGKIRLLSKPRMWLLQKPALVLTKKPSAGTADKVKAVAAKAAAADRSSQVKKAQQVDVDADSGAEDAADDPGGGEEAKQEQD